MSHPEFTQHELTKELRITQSAASCCLSRMLRRREIQRVSHGSYRRLASFSPPAQDAGQVAKSYAEFRSSLGDLRHTEAS
jgi:hypothetical protein